MKRLQNHSQVLLCVVLLFFVLGYANISSSQLNLVSTKPLKPFYNGMLVATLNSKVYNVPINYNANNKSNFQFKSDNNEIFDSNGDGVIISGFRKGEKMHITVIDQDQAYSTVSNLKWRKTNTNISGEGILILEGTESTHNLSFKVISTNLLK